MKKYFSLIIIFLFLFFMSGCNQSKEKCTVTLIDREDSYTIQVDKKTVLGDDFTTKPGYQVEGFYTDASFAETSRWDELTTLVTSDITLYVKTSQITYYIRVHSSGVDLNPIALHYDEVIQLPVLTKERSEER
ncbi:MAG: hypothetical protein PHP65_05395, partial [Bacilli bacterium]|nr:hypothetical protein [Bacilli bacterium]